MLGDVDYSAGQLASAGEMAIMRGAAEAEAFKPLPKGARELQLIRDAFVARHPSDNIVQHTNADATEQAFADAVASADYVHLNTHGFCVPLSGLRVADDPQQTADDRAASPLVAGIALAGANQVLRGSSATDGIMWADELAALDLHNAELVVLSACQTALGAYTPGEGMLGAQRALEVAGARSTLTTLWSVYDAPTLEFMGKFYNYHWEQGLPKGEALRRAQLDMLWGAGRAIAPQGTAGVIRLPPSFWAGFVLHGDWR
jgi:CHAT domain-containing protein